MAGWSAAMARTLHASPGGGGALVFQHDTLIEQFLPDAIGLGEVLAAARRLPRGDALLDPLRGHASGGSLQELTRLALQEAEHAAERLELARGAAVALEYAVGKLVQLGDRLGRAEIVVHRVAEALGVWLVPVDGHGGRGILLQRGVEPRQRLLGFLQ